MSGCLDGRGFAPRTWHCENSWVKRLGASRLRTQRPARVTVAALCTLLMGCTGGLASAPTQSANPSPQTTTSTVAARIECDSYVGTSPPPRNHEVVLGVVALPSSPTHPALQTAGGGGGGPLRLYAKTGLIVRSGTTFEVIVPHRVSDHLRIGWGGGSITPSQRVAVSDCPAKGGKGWLAYVGGYWIDHPACVPLIVKVGTRQQQVRIGLGTPCPGQQRP